VHQEVAAFGRIDQATDRGLLVFKVLLGLRQLHDVAGCILERDELVITWQLDWIVELALQPSTCII
jgi:hypothetical protein